MDSLRLRTSQHIRTDLWGDNCCLCTARWRNNWAEHATTTSYYENKEYFAKKQKLLLLLLPCRPQRRPPEYWSEEEVGSDDFYADSINFLWRKKVTNGPTDSIVSRRWCDNCPTGLGYVDKFQTTLATLAVMSVIPICPTARNRPNKSNILVHRYYTRKCIYSHL